MRNLSIVSAGALTLAMLSFGGSVGPQGREFISRYDNVLGTSFEIKLRAQSRAQADRAEAAILKEINRQSAILSTWSPDSEVSRWMQTHNQPVPVSAELFEVLGMYDQWQARTNGALNAAAGELINVWKNAEKNGHLPSQEVLKAAVTSANTQQWKLDVAHRTATHTGNASLVLASFTKSYILDHAADAGSGEGVRSMVLNMGGDIVVRGEFVEEVDIADPRNDAENAEPVTQVRLRNLSIATSGDYRRGFNIEGTHYSHIVDPRTGMPASNIISATVVAPRPADAGALATALSVLTPEEGAKAAAKVPGAAYLLIAANGQRIASNGWAALELRKAPAQVAALVPRRDQSSRLPAVTAGAPWDPSMELTINFELAPIGGTTHRPFMAAWIEDADHFQVRTLAVWFHEDRWVTEMKAWFRSDRMRTMAEGKEIFRSISAATRPPGKYSLKWDGKDNAGKLVKNGKYTVWLEIVREHGTYQLMKQEMDMTGTPKVVTFPGNEEVVSSSFDYHRITK